MDTGSGLGDGTNDRDISRIRDMNVSQEWETVRSRYTRPSKPIIHLLNILYTDVFGSVNFNLILIYESFKIRTE